MRLTGPVIQCAINLSEGRKREVIDEIAQAARGISGVIVADCSADPDHNRMVLSLLGRPACMKRAALRVAAKTVALVDLRRHEGAHPRTGAIDVVPFAPLRAVTMDDCVELARETGYDIANRFGIPVYFYEAAAQPGRPRSLPTLRRQLFREASGDGLPLGPDAGGPEPHESAGVCIVGARKPLIAFNVVLQSSDLALAERIAAEVRRLRERENRWEGVRALALALASRGLVQVSFNITRIRPGILSQIARHVRGRATDNGIAIAENQLIGLAPRASLEANGLGELAIHGLRAEQIVETWIEPGS
jgi:glutamate formiminotransferase